MLEGYEKQEFDDAKWERVRLPHTNRELPYNNFDEKDSQFISCYRKHFSWNKRDGKRVFMHFEGVMTAARVYLDGELDRRASWRVHALCL